MQVIFTRIHTDKHRVAQMSVITVFIQSYIILLVVLSSLQGLKVVAFPYRLDIRVLMHQATASLMENKL